MKILQKAALWYRARNRRERIMVVSVGAILLLIWFTGLAESSAALSAKRDAVENKLRVAEMVVAQGPSVQKRFEDMSKIFDAKKTIGAMSLQVRVEECARAAGLGASLSAVSTKDSGDFTIHSINVNCQKMTLATLAKFEREIDKLAPYLVFSRASFDGDGLVNAAYVISSFELKK